MNTTQPNQATVVQPSVQPDSKRRPAGVGILLAALVALSGAGCQTSPYATPTGSAVASITVAHHPLAQVALATDTVFLNHGFTGGRTGPDEYTYTHVSSRMVTLANGSSVERVSEHVIVTFKAYGDTVTATANGQWVDGPGEAPQKRSANAKPYQDLLDEAEARLK